MKVGCILFFFIWLVLEPKSNQSQSIPKIFRNVDDYRKTIVYRSWHIRSMPVTANFTIFSTLYWLQPQQQGIVGYVRLLVSRGPLSADCWPRQWLLQHRLAEDIKWRQTRKRRRRFVLDANKTTSFTCTGKNNQPVSPGQVRYDTIEEFNVDSKAECDQLNLAHAARNKI